MSLVVGERSWKQYDEIAKKIYCDEGRGLESRRKGPRSTSRKPVCQNGISHLPGSTHGGKGTSEEGAVHRDLPDGEGRGEATSERRGETQEKVIEKERLSPTRDKKIKCSRRYENSSSAH